MATSRVAIQNAQIKKQRLGQVRTRKNIKRSVPPPLGGWNTRDNIGNMPPTDAFVMTNMIPDLGSVNLRKGYQSFATNVGVNSAIEHIAEFRDNLGFEQIVTNSAGDVYRSTNGGNVLANKIFDGGAPEAVHSQGHGDYASVMFDDRLIMVNRGGGATGTALPREISPFAISRGSDGVVDQVNELALTHPTLDLSTLTGVHAYKNRLFFWADDSVDVFYLDIDLFQGALTRFPLSTVAGKGSKLVAMSSFTIDGGDGIDDYAVFIMDSGQVLVYQGTDPARSSAWALVGKFQIGKPLSRNAIKQFGGQLLVATEFDYVTLPGAFLKGGFQEPTKLSGAAQEAVRLHRDKVGWQIVFYSKGGWLLVNVPQGGDTFHQHVLNLRSSAAFKIEGWNARTFGVVDGDLYFGDLTGTVWKANDTNADNGANISAKVKQAFSDLGSQEEKHIDECRVMMTAEGVINPSTGIIFDFEESPLELQSQELGPREAVAQWGDDWGTDWGFPSRARYEWQIAAGSGTSVSMELRLATRNQDVSWFRTDYIGRQSGNL